MNYLGGCEGNDWPMTIPESGQADIFPVTFRRSGSNPITYVGVEFKGFRHTYPRDVACILTKWNPITQRYHYANLFCSRLGGSNIRGQPWNFLIASNGVNQVPNTPIPANWPAQPWRPSGTNDIEEWLATMEIPFPLNANNPLQIHFNDLIGIPPYGCWSLWIGDTHALDGGSIDEIILTVN